MTDYYPRNYDTGPSHAPTELVPGVKFYSPREDEGLVSVICEYGKCSHSSGRPESVHVGGYVGEERKHWSEWFIALPSNWPIEEFGATWVG